MEKIFIKVKKKFYKENKAFAELLGNNIVPLNPEIGYYFKVNGLDISEDIFPTEYKAIHMAYFRVIKKLKMKQK